MTTNHAGLIAVYNHYTGSGINSITCTIDGVSVPQSNIHYATVGTISHYIAQIYIDCKFNSNSTISVTLVPSSNMGGVGASFFGI